MQQTQVLQRYEARMYARGSRQSGLAAFQGRQPLVQYIDSRIAVAAVVVARLFTRNDSGVLPLFSYW